MSPVRPTHVEAEIDVVHQELLVLAKGRAITRTVQVGTTVTIDVKIRLGARARDANVRRAIVDALTRSLEGLYEDGYAIEDARYEPGSSEWVGWVVGNMDRIEVCEGVMLRDVTSEERRAWVERVLTNNEEVRVKR